MQRFYSTLFGRLPNQKDLVEKASIADAPLLRRMIYSDEFSRKILQRLGSPAPLPHDIKRIDIAEHANWLTDRFGFEGVEARALESSENWAAFFERLLSSEHLHKILRSQGSNNAPNAVAKLQAIHDALERVAYFRSFSALADIRAEMNAHVSSVDMRHLHVVTPGERRFVDDLFRSSGRGEIEDAPATLGGLLASHARAPGFEGELLPSIFGELRDFSTWRKRPPTRDDLALFQALFGVGADPAQAPQVASWSDMLRSALAVLPLWAASLTGEALEDFFVYTTLRNLGSTDGRRLEAHLEAASGQMHAVNPSPHASAPYEVELLGDLDAPLARQSGDIAPDSGVAIAAPAEIEIAPRAAAFRVGGGLWTLSRWPAGGATVEGRMAEASEIAVSDAVSVLRLEAKGRVVELELTGSEALNAPLSLMIDGEIVSLTEAPVRDRDVSAYVGLLAAAREGSFPLATEPAPPGTPCYDLRIGEAKGLRPANLPAALVFSAKLVCHSAPVLRGGAISGWAFSAVSAKHLAVARLRARPADAADPEIEPVTLVIGSCSTKIASPDAELIYGGSVATSAYEIPLNETVLDGNLHSVTVEIDTGVGSVEIAAFDLRADDAFFEEQFATISRGRDLHLFLMAIAKAGRHDIIEAFYQRIDWNGPFPLADLRHFEILCHLTLTHPSGVLGPQSATVFETLWASTLADNAKLGEFVDSARQIALLARPTAERARFPLSPLTECATDLLIAGEVLGSVNVDRDVRRAGDAIEVKRYALAVQLADRLRRHHPSNPSAALVAARLAMSLGDIANAEKMSRAALDFKAGFRDAEVVLARSLMLSNRHLDAISVFSGGRGLNASVDKPVSMEAARMALPLDWVEYVASAAEVGSNRLMSALAENSKKVHKAAAAFEETTFSVFFLKAGSQKVGMRGLHDALGDNCCLVSMLEHDDMSDVPCSGQWAYLFVAARGLKPIFLEHIYAQRRPFENVVAFYARPRESSWQAPFELRGALVRADLLSCFGHCSFEDYVRLSGKSFKVKTILIQD